VVPLWKGDEAKVRTVGGGGGKEIIHRIMDAVLRGGKGHTIQRKRSKLKRGTVVATRQKEVRPMTA